MLRTTCRPLTLHVSALSNSEYKAYTTSLADVTSPMPDAAWENITLGVREARGWIRGRYGVDGSVIDQILRYFCPELGSHDTLTGGQFFAALRLVCHAQSGTAPDESLVFVQANPDPTAVPGARSPSLSRPPSTKSVAPPPPPRPTPDTPALPPRTAPPLPSANPFTRSSPRSQTQSLPQDKGKPAAAADQLTSNPFRVQSGSPAHPKSAPAPAPSLSSTSSTPSSPANPKQYAAYTSPPLPPRKSVATRLPPPRHGSFTGLPTAPAPSMKSLAPSKVSGPALTPPLLPPPSKPPAPPHPTSPLIKQSLQAAKGAQSVKEVMDGLSKERRWEVIKKSAGGTGGSGSVNGSRSGSTGGSAGSGEAATYRPSSPPESFYDVAAARIERTASPYASSSASSSPNRTQHPTPAPARISATSRFAHVLTPDTPPSPSPKSGIPSPSSPVATPRRAKSLQHPSPSTSSPPSSPSAPPQPPPRRRRPESVQVTSPGGRSSADVGSPFTNGAAVNGTHARGRSHSGPGTEGLSHSLSFSGASPSGHPAVLDTLQRKFSSLRPGAGFESARVRAEGRVWPGGYVKGLARGPGQGGFAGGGERLVGDQEGDGGFGQDGIGGDGGFHDGAEQDGGDDEKEKEKMERDGLKMPVRPGEGWTAL